MKKTPLTLVFMSLPGAGKGTQAKAVAKKFGSAYLATGDITRELAQFDPEVKERMDKGVPQPDEVIFSALRNKLKNLDLKNGIALDAFPLSINQAHELDKMIAELKLSPPIVFYLKVDPKKLIIRLGKRVVCPQCGSIFYPGSASYYNKKCDRCWVDLVQREDDQPQIIQRRIREYQKRIKPLIEFYKKRGQLIEINGEPAISQVTGAILEKLESILKGKR